MDKRKVNCRKVMGSWVIQFPPHAGWPARMFIRKSFPDAVRLINYWLQPRAGWRWWEHL